MKNKILIWILVLLSSIAILLFVINFNNTSEKKRQIILIGVDGLNVDHFNKLLAQNKLQNFQRLVGDGGLNSEALITGHKVTETAPGNAELHTGLPAEITRVFNNACGGEIPAGKTIFERLMLYDKDIKIGSIYGKGTCYLNSNFFKDVSKNIAWWHDTKTYKQNNYIGDNCTNSIDVAKKATEFLNMYRDEDFYLFIYFGSPDCVGHRFGVPSPEYDNVIKNVDEGLGIILDKLKDNSNNPQIIVSGDHGWNINTKGHSVANLDTRRVVLISNSASMINDRKDKKQCDIAPTILDYFGIKSEQYGDIINAGCESLQ